MGKKNPYNYGKPPKKREDGINNPKATQAAIELLKSKWASRRIMILVIVLILILVVLADLSYSGNFNQNESNTIERPYTQVLKKLDEEPDDITSVPYQENMPSIIQKDINKMLTMGEDAKIVYYSEDKACKMIIRPSERSESGYQISFFDGHQEYFFGTLYEIENNLSFYRSGDQLIVYGGEDHIRTVKKYSLNNEKVEYYYLEYDYTDLFGTNGEYDDIRYFSNYFTLTREDNKFSFYHLGEKIAETIFEDGKIKKWDYYYLLTEEGECYNVYYSLDKDDIWIRFYKVADSVEKILEDEYSIFDADGHVMNFHMLSINGRKYAAIPDATTERIYGQNFGDKHINEDNITPNFDTELVEISAANITKAEFVAKEYRISSDKEWYIRYYISVGNRECFVEQRINGIDSGITDLIPEEELEKFDRKTIAPDQITEEINKLKALYDTYTENEF